MIIVGIYDGLPVYVEGLAFVLSRIGMRVTCFEEFPSPDALDVDVFILGAYSASASALRQLAIATPVIIVGEGIDDATRQEYARAGVFAFVARSAEVSVIIDSTVQAAGSRSSSEVADQPAPMRNESPLDHLSPREMQVLGQIADGMTHNQIARKLGISPHTVDTYVKRIRSKLPVGNKADLTRVALLGLSCVITLKDLPL
jgi:DNA-binding NarL/FixJ family response regulator